MKQSQREHIGRAITMILPMLQTLEQDTNKLFNFDNTEIARSLFWLERANEKLIKSNPVENPAEV